MFRCANCGRVVASITSRRHCQSCRPIVAALRETTQQLGQHAASEGLTLEDVEVEHRNGRTTIEITWRSAAKEETP